MPPALTFELRTWILRMTHRAMVVSYFKIHQRMTKLQSGHEKQTHFLPLTSKCQLDHEGTDLHIAHDTSSHGR